jgi:SOS-response transcriptional repressor LexA
MLTDMQLRTLRFIEARVGTTGVAPSYSELAKALGVSSKSGVNRLVCALEERGYIRRIPHRARAIEVVRRPTTLLDPARELRAYLDARHGQGFTAALRAVRWSSSTAAGSTTRIRRRSAMPSSDLVEAGAAVRLAPELGG